jgi:hypothetical protein
MSSAAFLPDDLPSARHRRALLYNADGRLAFNPGRLPEPAGKVPADEAGVKRSFAGNLNWSNSLRQPNTVISRREPAAICRFTHENVKDCFFGNSL